MRTRRAEKSEPNSAENSVAGLRHEQPLHTQFLDQCEGTLPEVLDEHALDTLNIGLAFVFALLREAKRQFDEEGDAGRAAAFTAMGALWQFAALFEKPYREGLHIPIVDLMVALQALDDNSVLPVVRPTPRPGRSPSNHAHLALKGHSAAAVRRLVSAGLEPQRTHKAVAAELRKLGVRAQRGSGDLTHTTIRNWCKQISRAVSREGTAAAYYDDTLKDPAERQFSAIMQGGDRLAARQIALSAFSRWVQLHTAAQVVNPLS